MHKQIIINVPENASELKFNLGDEVRIDNTYRPASWHKGVVVGINLLTDSNGFMEWEYNIKIDSGWSFQWCKEETIKPSSLIPQLEEEWLNGYAPQGQAAIEALKELGDW